MKIVRRLRAHATQDGDGVNIHRIADFTQLSLDPYLMIDELKSDQASDYIGGFPPHPHRGIETFTYILRGGFQHQDQMGNVKDIRTGQVQWMSTGFGVMHSEMPLASEDGAMHGFQIWLNMPAKDKLRPAKYQDSSNQSLPYFDNGAGGKLTALAGSWLFAGKTLTSPLNQLTAQAAIADVQLNAHGTANLALQHFEQVVLYIHSGELSQQNLTQGQAVIVDSQVAIELTGGEEGAGVLVLAGQKINEKIAHMGPFVMNTQAELQQAVADFQAGKFGQLAL
ncbi:pirin family protein [Motilimonas pumila]|uniref:Pirin family protein n=1 Tax=Motilimonas pumila TaxID=2303987 RepID=A0A418YI67_9GAMM|nr:pirin family protein [Motilimonas pumila]RJG49921.1 pirin family protein [Motilimonas pumila]